MSISILTLSFSKDNKTIQNDTYMTLYYIPQLFKFKRQRIYLRRELNKEKS